MSGKSVYVLHEELDVKWWRFNSQWYLYPKQSFECRSGIVKSNLWVSSFTKAGIQISKVFRKDLDADTEAWIVTLSLVPGTLDSSAAVSNPDKFGKV